jgi:hypothetical protein
VTAAGLAGGEVFLFRAMTFVAAALAGGACVARRQADRRGALYTLLRAAMERLTSGDSRVRALSGALLLLKTGETCRMTSAGK